MATKLTSDRRAHTKLQRWLLSDITSEPAALMGPHRIPPVEEEAHGHTWWQVMCLTGVYSLSTLGYQPGIAALAAGTIAPLATVVLIALTVFGALPVYRDVARKAPNGEGSIAMLEHLLPRWGGKTFVLVLIGFAATDFLITLILLGLLAAVFLRGFTEAITVVVALVAVYLGLNLVVLSDGMWQILSSPHLVVDWRHAMTAEHGSPVMMIGLALIVFPKLALGLSGFETGARSCRRSRVREKTGRAIQAPASPAVGAC